MTKIEWCEESWNPIVGCSLVSPGCTNCYAMRQAARIEAMFVGTHMKAGGGTPFAPSHYAGLTQDSKAGPVWTGKVAMVDNHALTKPLRWKRPRRVFVNSMGDVFYKDVERWWIARVFGVMIASHHLKGHIFQVLTKRSAEMRIVLNDPEFWDEVNAFAETEVMDRVDPLARRRDDARATLRDYGPDDPPPFIWLGVSAEDQDRANERIPDLLATPAAVRFVSAEPLLGLIDLVNPLYRGEGGITMRGYLRDKAEPDDFHFHANKLDWVIVGGESGEGARSMHRKWARDIRDQCDRADVPFFFKQWGEWIDSDEWIAGLKANGAVAVSGVDLRYDLRPLTFGQAAQIAENAGWECAHGSDGSTAIRVGKRRAGRRLDGVEHNAFPRDAA